MIDNSVTLLGHIGNDIVLKHSQAGQPFTKASIAVSSSYADKNGNYVRSTNWFRIVAFGKTATLLAQQLHKGSQVLIEGKLSASSYTDAEGKLKSSTEIIVASFKAIAKNNSKADQAPLVEQIINATLEHEAELPF
jgi:single stranded DNA-binding protein (ssb)